MMIEGSGFGSGSRPAPLAQAVIIILPRDKRMGEERKCFRGEGLEGVGLKREGLKGLLFV